MPKGIKGSGPQEKPKKRYKKSKVAPILPAIKEIAEAAKGGRPTVYLPEMDELVYRCALTGMTHAEMAQVLGITEATLNDWIANKHTFSDSLKAGRGDADSHVAQKLFNRAMGMSIPAVKIFYDQKSGAVIEHPYLEHYPPDPTSMIFWLKNRQRAHWRDRHTLEGDGLSKLAEMFAAAEDRFKATAVTTLALPPAPDSPEPEDAIEVES